MRYRIEKRADGKWHVFAVGESVTVFWDTWELAKIYLDARIRCDREERGEEFYSTIRQYLGGFIGRRIVDITQHDEADWRADEKGFVMLMFEDGSVLQFVQPEVIRYEGRHGNGELVQESEEHGLPETE